jgi:hypothetical protein
MVHPFSGMRVVTFPPVLQGFNLDAWALGLCLLHLLTGQPHYEVYDGVRCPAMLAEALLDEWNVDNGGKAYRCVQVCKMCWFGKGGDPGHRVRWGSRVHLRGLVTPSPPVVAVVPLCW